MKLWRQIAARVDKMSMRERGWVFAALVLLVATLANTVLLDPEWSRQKLLSRQLAQRHADLAAMQDQIQKLAEADQSTTTREQRTRLERLRRETVETESRIVEEQRRFTGPDQMRSVLEEMLGRNRRVALLNMRTLAPSAFAQGGAAKPAAEQGGRSAVPQTERPVYRHAIELTVSGSYFDLLAYVSDLEHLPRQLYWNGVELDAAAHPIVKMRITVFTLSLSKAWMSV